MAEKIPPEPAGDLEATGENAEETIFNSEIGDDWGEAFEAEDFMFSPDNEESSEFFLDDDSFDQTPSPAADSSTSPSQTESATTPLGQSAFSKNTLFALPLALFTQCRGKLTAAPVFIRLAVLATPLIALTILYLSLSGTNDTAQLDKKTTIATQTEGNELLKNTQVKTSQENTKADGTEKMVPVADLAIDKPIVEKIRKKWRLPSFLISATTHDTVNKAPAFVAIDITFVLLLPPDDLIPDSREFFVREIIYQFYNNRPLDELQRFSLARGEMNRKLRSWVEKQWPEIPLSSIAFDRYQIL